MENMLNVKTNWKHSFLEHQIKRWDTAQDMSRAAVLERQVRAAQGSKNWREIRLSLPDQKPEEDFPIFSNFQARYSEETGEILEIIRGDILDQLRGEGMKVLQTQYLLLLLQENYLAHLKRERMTVRGAEESGEDMDLPTMAKVLFEMGLSDKDSDELRQIAKIMRTWRRKK